MKMIGKLETAQGFQREMKREIIQEVQPVVDQEVAGVCIKMYTTFNNYIYCFTYFSYVANKLGLACNYYVIILLSSGNKDTKRNKAPTKTFDGDDGDLGNLSDGSHKSLEWDYQVNIYDNLYQGDSTS